MWQAGLQEAAATMDDLTFRVHMTAQGINHENQKWFSAQRRMVMEQNKAAAMLAHAKTTVWRDWQASLIEKLQGEPHHRHIYVVLDKTGNSGKTFFAKTYKLINNETVCSLTNGKTGDLMHVASKKPNLDTVFVNLPRSVHGVVNYQAYEQLKDGEFTTTKYDGSEVTLPPLNVAMFTNEPLNWEAMSKDRWQIMTIKKDGTFIWEDYAAYKKAGGQDGVAQREFGQKRSAEPDVEPPWKKRKPADKRKSKFHTLLAENAVPLPDYANTTTGLGQFYEDAAMENSDDEPNWE